MNGMLNFKTRMCHYWRITSGIQSTFFTYNNMPQKKRVGVMPTVNVGLTQLPRSERRLFALLSIVSRIFS